MFKSITTKLFVIFTAVVIFLMGSMLFMQSVFFEKYYISKKTQSMKKINTDLVKIYASAEDKYSTKILSTVDQYSQNYGFTIFYIGNNVSSEDSSSSTGSSSTTISMTASPSKGEVQNFFNEQASYGHDFYLKNKSSMDAGKSMTYSAKDSYGNTNIIIISSIITDGKPQGLLYLFSSLQPISEAAGVIKDYYAIFFIAAFIVILAVSFLLSRQITKPLIHINKVASSIANQDFSEECMIKSEDELGSLANTINLLSDNLSSAIEKLKESNKRLEREIDKQKELEDMRKLFVAGVSHELKTPISVIRGYTEGILDGIEKGVVKKEYAAIIQDETEKMSSIVSDMLDLSQMESGKYELNIETLTVNRMVRYEIKKFLPMFESKNLRLNVSLTDENMIVQGDSRRIEQVLANLLSNAVRYTPHDGDIFISVTKAENNISFEIENSCPEISKEELCRIWDDFYRIDKSGSRELGGTGLGLTVVKNILELHKSSYGVVKTERGVKFYFTLGI